MRAGAGTRPSRRDMTVLTLPETKIPDELARTLTELPVPLAAVLRAAHAKVRAELTGERESTARYPTWRSLVLAANDGDLPVEPPLDVRDADAARIAGYHSRALELIAADSDAEHGRQSLLSAEELHFQLHGLAGRRTELPDRRVHELFEEHVRAHPDAVAAVHGERQWTYGELNSRANRLARALLAHGLRREGVVAVVTERNLDWLAAVLAIFKAGGAYLPIEPHFPADRIARTMSRAGCRLVLTERGSTAMLDQALQSVSGVETLFIDAACEEGHSDRDLGVGVARDQLAYIYFTSGSTGEPKGAMCEHAGDRKSTRLNSSHVEISYAVF